MIYIRSKKARSMPDDFHAYRRYNLMCIYEKNRHNGYKSLFIFILLDRI